MILRLHGGHPSSPPRHLLFLPLPSPSDLEFVLCSRSRSPPPPARLHLASEAGWCSWGGQKSPSLHPLTPAAPGGVYRGCSPAAPSTAPGTWGLRARSSPLGSPARVSHAAALPLNYPNPVVFSSSVLGNNGRPCAGPGCPSPSLQLARPPVLSSSEQDQLKPSFPFTLFKGLPIHWGHYRLHETFGSQWAVCAGRQRALPAAGSDPRQKRLALC